MNEFKTFILGEPSVWVYLAASFLMLLGIIFMWAFRIKRGIRKNPMTPDKFSGKFLIKDRLFQIALSLIIGIIGGFFSLRLVSEIWDVKLSAAIAIAIGLSFDAVINKIASWKSKLNINL